MPPDVAAWHEAWRFADCILFYPHRLPHGRPQPTFVTRLRNLGYPSRPNHRLLKL